MCARGAAKNEQMREEAVAVLTKTALQVFAEYGFHGTTMNRIATASGLSKGLTYHYFPSKEKLFYHLIDSAIEISVRTWSDAFDSPGTAWEKIQRLAENLVEISFTEDNSRYYLIMIQAMTQGQSIPGMLEYIQGKTDHFERLPVLIVEAQETGEVAQGDPEVLTSSFLAMFQGYSIMTYHDENLQRKITPDVFLSVLRG